MRLVLPYSQAVLHDVQAELGNLPQNICADFSDKPAAHKLVGTFEMFLAHPQINSGIFSDPAWHKKTAEVETLHKISNGYIVNVYFKEPNSFDSVYLRLQEYFTSRTEGIYMSHPDVEPYFPSDDEVALISETLYRDLQFIHDSNSGTVVAATTTYNPLYGNDKLDGAWLNPHIDQLGRSNYDARVVHTLEANATVSFSSDDFSLTEDSQQKDNKWNITLSDPAQIVHGWAGPEGSYTVMRTPSDHNLGRGALPTVHAHGSMRLEDRRRWTARYDIKFG